MNQTIVSLSNAGRAFGNKSVLHSIDAEIRSGEVVGIIGPNGGGKSTLLMMMAGLLTPTTGTVRVCGTLAHQLAREQAGTVGLVLARPGMYPLLKGWENLIYFGNLFGMTAETIKKKATPLLDAFDLSNHMDKPLQVWSTGMQQKLSLVRALILSPKLLLFDEPAANLDPIASNTLYDTLRQRANQTENPPACVCVTHDLAAAERVCDRVWVVQGTIKEEIVIPNSHKDVVDNLLFQAWTRSVL